MDVYVRREEDSSSVLLTTADVTDLDEVRDLLNGGTYHEATGSILRVTAGQVVVGADAAYYEFILGVAD